MSRNNSNEEENFEDYEKYEEYSEEDKKLNILSYDDIKNSNTINSDDYIIYDDNYKDKYKINNFINNPSLISLISSYESSNIKENIDGLKWKLDNNSKYINHIIVSKYPTKNRYILNPNVYGYNLRNISVKFNTNYYSPINNIGILFTLKFNDIISCNLLNINENNYENAISVNIIKKDMDNNKEMGMDMDRDRGKPINIANNYGLIGTEEGYVNYKKTYDIELNINNNKYMVHDISEDILREPVIFLGLIINKDRIYFYINDKISDFKRLDSKNIVLEYPFYINKNKNCDFMLYSNALIINDINIKNSIEKYNLYNNYNLHSKMNI